jgi:hypothetical protein
MNGVPIKEALEALTTLAKIVDRLLAEKEQRRVEAANALGSIQGLLWRFQDLINLSRHVNLSRTAVREVQVQWASAREELFRLKLTYRSPEIGPLVDEVVKTMEASFAAAYEFCATEYPSTTMFTELEPLEDRAWRLALDELGNSPFSRSS